MTGFRRTFHLVAASAILVVLSLLVVPPLGRAGDPPALKVGVYNFSPMVFVDPGGAPRGLFVDVLDHIARREGWRVTYVPGTWNESLQRLESGQIDLLASVGYSAERERTLDFPKEFLILDWGLVYQRTDGKMDTVFDLSGRRIAVLKGSIYTEGFRDLLRQFRIDAILVEKDEYGQVFESLVNRECAAGICANLAGINYEKRFPVERTSILFTPVRITFAAPKGKHAEVIAALDRHISSMKAGKDSFLKRKTAEWLEHPINRLSTRTVVVIALLVSGLLVLVTAITVLARQIRSRIRDLAEANRRLSEKDSLLSALVDGTSDAIYAKDTGGRYLLFNAASCRFAGKIAKEVIGNDDTVLFPPGEAGTVMEGDRRVMASGKTETYEERVTTTGGETVFLSTKGPLLDAAGNITGMFGIARDITDRKRAEMALSESTARLDLALRSAGMGIWHWDIVNNLREFDDRVCELLGIDREKFTGSAEEFFAVVRPEDRDKVREALARTLERDVLYESEYWAVRPEGSARHISARGTLVRDERGKPLRINGVLWDSTDGRRLKEEKEQLQAQLQQAQKMEAVGRLAGGVAHDFNNLLTVIIGNISLALDKISPSGPSAGMLEEASKAAERAAQLTQQLLAFSRKQVIEPKVLDLNMLITDMQKMLGRLIGEDIEVRFVPGEDLGPVKVDPGVFEQVLVNLAVNARDAMRDGGKLTIETRSVRLDEEYCGRHPHVLPGRFVLMAVIDTGCGIPDGIRAMIFDPFFTTKPKGSGTGLGLSMVYGAVKQSGGSIEVDSEVGKGTTFRIYLPQVDEKVVEPIRDDGPTERLGGTERVLLVEDEEILRKLCVRILEGLGYDVVQAGNGAEAMKLAGACREPIPLVITDVVMPGMSGAELASQLVLLHPETRILFTSGYTEDAIVHRGVLDEGVSFIGKPYTPLALAKKIREVLDKE